MASYERPTTTLAGLKRYDLSWTPMTAFTDVNGQGQTMVVKMPQPGTFQRLAAHRRRTGRRTRREDREAGQENHQPLLRRDAQSRWKNSRTRNPRSITRTSFARDHQYNKQYSNKPDCPINKVTWYEAAEQSQLANRTGGTEPVYQPNNDKKYGPGMKAESQLPEAER